MELKIKNIENFESIHGYQNPRLSKSALLGPSPFHTYSYLPVPSIASFDDSDLYQCEITYVRCDNYVMNVIYQYELFGIIGIKCMDKFNSNINLSKRSIEALLTYLHFHLK